MHLEGRVALITGGARGVGFAIAEGMARQGAKLVLMDPGGSKTGQAEAGAAPAEAAAERLRALGATAIAIAESVADHAGCGRAVAATLAQFGRIDILVNNAGVLRPRMIWNLPVEDWDAVVAVHLRGAYSMIHHAAPAMREQRSGRIINMASEAWRGTVGQANYGAAKGGIFSLTRAMARELGARGITTNTLCPAAATRLTMDDAVKKGFEKRLAAGLITQARFDQVMDMGGPEHIAPFACWLASDAAAHVNGQAFRVERGMIGIYNEPELRAVLHRADDGLFTPEELSALVPRALLAGYVNPAPAAAEERP
jgi:3-oxoacyl-[acyl-carrier protein] reductase